MSDKRQLIRSTRQHSAIKKFRNNGVNNDDNDNNFIDINQLEDITDNNDNNENIYNNNNDNDNDNNENNNNNNNNNNMYNDNSNEEINNDNNKDNIKEQDDNNNKLQHNPILQKQAGYIQLPVNRKIENKINTPRLKNCNFGSMIFSNVILVAIEDNEGIGEEELSFSKGDTIYFLEQDKNFWVYGSLENGQKGWFDRTLVKFISGKNNPFLQTDEDLYNKQLELQSMIVLSQNKEDKKEKRDILSRFFDQKKKKKNPKYSVFGKPLEDITSEEHPLPIIILQIIEYIKYTEGYLIEGIFRITGNQEETEDIKIQYDSPLSTAYLEGHNIHCIAVLLKQYLMELPNPLIPFKFYKIFIESYNDYNEEINIKTYINLLKQLPSQNLDILRYIIEFLVLLCKHSDNNKMNSVNLGVVFAPSIIRTQNPDPISLMNTTNRKIISLFIEQYSNIFIIRPTFRVPKLSFKGSSLMIPDITDINIPDSNIISSNKSPPTSKKSPRSPRKLLSSKPKSLRIKPKRVINRAKYKSVPYPINNESIQNDKDNET